MSLFVRSVNWIFWTHFSNKQKQPCVCSHLHTRLRVHISNFYSQSKCQYDDKSSHKVSNSSTNSSRCSKSTAKEFRKENQFRLSCLCRGKAFGERFSPFCLLQMCIKGCQVSLPLSLSLPRYMNCTELIGMIVKRANFEAVLTESREKKLVILIKTFLRQKVRLKLLVFNRLWAFSLCIIRIRVVLWISWLQCNLSNPNIEFIMWNSVYGQKKNSTPYLWPHTIARLWRMHGTLYVY